MPCRHCSVRFLSRNFFAPPKSARAFSYLRGTEYARIFRNACHQYAIQEDSLLRYASRRHARQEIQQLLQSVNTHD